jgi:diacylglycerol kinase family enzyme
METFRAEHIEVTSDRQQRRELDGDLIEPPPPLAAAVRPAALWLCVPPKTLKRSFEVAQTP